MHEYPHRQVIGMGDFLSALLGALIGGTIVTGFVLFAKVYKDGKVLGP